MTLTPALRASSAAAAAADPSTGQMMMTLTPFEIRDSTFAFSLAESFSLNRIVTLYPAFVNASWNRVWSWVQRSSSFVGRTTPTASFAPLPSPLPLANAMAGRRRATRLATTIKSLFITEASLCHRVCNIHARISSEGILINSLIIKRIINRSIYRPVQQADVIPLLVTQG